MTITRIDSYLVFPSKKAYGPTQFRGTEVELSGQVFDLLNKIYKKANEECNIDISFNMSEDGNQHNLCRSLFLNYMNYPSLSSGYSIADRLAQITTERSGLGLLFIIKGQNDKLNRMMIARFAVDNGILAEESLSNINLKFIDKVFLKNAISYKAVLYEDKSINHGFWRGSAVDRQINAKEIRISNYWIKDFLLSDFITTKELGSRRLLFAIRDSINQSSDEDIKRELFSALNILPNFSGKSISPSEFMETLSFSEASRDLVKSNMKSQILYDQKFLVHAQTLAEAGAYRFVALDNGAALSAPTDKFDDIFNVHDSENKGLKTFKTEGSIIHDKIRRTQ